MKFLFTKTEINHLYLISYEKFKDERGAFFRNYCQEQISEANPLWNGGIKQASLSINPAKGTIRGFHYSLNPSESKLMSCTSGRFFVAIKDLNRASPTAGKVYTITLGEQNINAILVPPKCATAFQTLEDNSIMQYFMTENFSEGDYRGFRYDQIPEVIWPIKLNVIISQNDLKEGRSSDLI